MATTFEELARLKAEYETKVHDEGLACFKHAFAEFFAAQPRVSAVQWRQYTPHFNDGEPCRFGVDEEWRVRVEGLDPETADYADGFRNQAGDAAIDDALDALVGALEPYRHRDVYLAAFGDHARVTATRDGFQVEQFRHD